MTLVGRDSVLLTRYATCTNFFETAAAAPVKTWLAQEGPATTMVVAEKRAETEMATTMGQREPARDHFFDCWIMIRAPQVEGILIADSPESCDLGHTGRQISRVDALWCWARLGAGNVRFG